MNITGHVSALHILQMHFWFGGQWDNVKLLLMAITFIFVFCSVEVVYSRYECISLFLPKPASLLLFGILFGYLSSVLKCEMNFFNEFFFFGFLFPPLAINAALDFKNIVKQRMSTVVAFFGILGSVFCFSLTGLCLWGVHEFKLLGLNDYEIKPIAFVLFSSLVCSTDLAIVFGLLGRLKVHPFLYLLFVGESLINDGVSLSLFTMSNNAAKSHIWCVENFGMLPWLALMLLSFTIQVALCAIVGIIFGMLSSIVTRWTDHETTLEPVIVFCLCYTGYIITYICSWPSTFYLIFFCTVLSSFTFRNISHKSVITIRHFVRMTSAVADSLIFLYVGFSVSSHELEWRTGFVAWATFFSVFWRFLFIYFASYLSNYFFWTRHKITPGMMFFISYGGFKGSVAHALVEIVSVKCAAAIGIPLPILRCTVVFINLFYVLFIGVTMTPLLRIYKFMSSERSKLSLFETLNDQVIVSACHALTDAIGNHQSPSRLAIIKFYKRYLRPLLLRDPNKHDDITDVYADIALALHHASVAKDRKSAHFHLRRLRPQLKRAFYFQQQQQHPELGGGGPRFAAHKPHQHISLHHLDLLSEPTDTTTYHPHPPNYPQQLTTAYSRETSVAISPPPRSDFEDDLPRHTDILEEEEGEDEEVFYDISCDDQEGQKKSVVSFSPPRRRKWKSRVLCGCCPSRSGLFNSLSEASAGLNERGSGGDAGRHRYICPGDVIQTTEGPSQRPRPQQGDSNPDDDDDVEAEGLFRQMLSRQARHAYAFDESAFAERVQQSIQSKHRALQLHHHEHHHL